MALDVVALAASKKYTDKQIEGIESEGIGEAIREKIEANTAARHTHNNKDILDCFDINVANTRPTFKGAGNSRVTLAAIDDVIDRNNSLRNDLEEQISLLPKFATKVVDELPTEDISNTTIYFLRGAETDNNLYTEYIYVNDIWECLGGQRKQEETIAQDEDVMDAMTEMGLIEPMSLSDGSIIISNNNEIYCL